MSKMPYPSCTLTSAGELDYLYYYFDEQDRFCVAKYENGSSHLMVSAPRVCAAGTQFEAFRMTFTVKDGESGFCVVTNYRDMSGD